jgi:hypothetical protein
VRRLPAPQPLKGGIYRSGQYFPSLVVSALRR